MTAKARLLYVTDLAYQAAGRRYCDEDIYLSERLRTHFFVALCHPRDVADLMASFDVVVVRNSGPAQNYRADYDAYRQRARELGKPFFDYHGSVAARVAELGISTVHLSITHDAGIAAAVVVCET